MDGKLYADGKLIGTEGRLVMPEFKAISVPGDLIQEEPAEIKVVSDEPVKPKRAPRTHRFLHPTKGWRMFARHGKANRRRKLIRQGVLSVRNSHAFAHEFRKWTPDRRLLAISQGRYPKTIGDPQLA